MKVDYLILGQGLCGSFLSYYLQKKNCSFVVIDNNNSNTASKIASGVINPITGRRFVKTWMIDEVLPFAKNGYQKIEKELNCKILNECSILNFHTTPQMQLAFEERVLEEKKYLQNTDNEFNTYFNYNFNVVKINNCLLININILIQKIKEQLLNNNQLINEQFDFENCVIENNYVKYNNITAKKLIYCDGIANTNTQLFKYLPYAANKGEALIVEINNLPTKHIYKSQFTIAHWKDNLFWIGSTYEWNFETTEPTQAFRNKVENFLKFFLKLEYKVIDHLSAVRPANIERRPFVGFHPIQKNIGILNGMGTKGCSLAPYFANEFVNHITDNQVIDPLVNIERFKNILSKK